MNTKEERNKIEKHILTFFKKLDKSGINEQNYKNFFKGLSDQNFFKWLDKFLETKEDNFYLESTPYKNQPRPKDIQEAADYLKVPLDEVVHFRHDGTSTTEPCPVGWLFVKRHQQILSKKNSYSKDIFTRNFKTGQVADSAKAARLSDMELYALKTIGADKILKELTGLRADDGKSKEQAYRNIAAEGFALQSELESSVRDKTTLNTVNMFFLMAGIQVDLVNDSLVLPISTEK